MTREPTAAEMLAELFEDQWAGGLCSYRLNVALQCPPWWPPLPQVWARREPPASETALQAQCWPAALSLLERLHAEYLRQVSARGLDGRRTPMRPRES